MAGVVKLLLLGLPVMILSLLAGLGLCVMVLVDEGRGRSYAASRLLGWINLALTAPLALLAWTAEARDAQLMFVFAATVFALVGAMGLRLARRARDEASS